MEFPNICSGDKLNWFALGFAFMFEFYMGKNRLKPNSSIALVGFVLFSVYVWVRSKFERPHDPK